MFIPRNYNVDKRIIILSGSGLDAPSGVPTYRAEDGLWEEHNLNVICNEDTWKANYTEMNKFYDDRRIELASKLPNEGHHGITRIVTKHSVHNVHSVTQNITDLLEQSGSDSLHVHGKLGVLRCDTCGHQYEIGNHHFELIDDMCTSCGGIQTVRPSVVFFNGAAPMYTYMARAMEATLNEDSILIVIGTQGNVVNVQNIIDNSKCKTILCNMEPSSFIDHSKFDKVYFESIETAIAKIEKDVDDWWS